MKRIVSIATLTVFLILFLSLIRYLTSFHLNAEFSELRPIHTRLAIYYKGIVVGYAREIRHSFDFGHTIIKLVIYSKKMHLPENTTVILKKEKRNNKEKDYLELIYPNEPSNILLSNNSKIKGFVASDMSEFLSNQHPDDINEMKKNLAESVQNLNNALENLVLIFETLNEILKENQNNIYKTTTNIEKATSKINYSIKQKEIENTILNLEKTTSSVFNSAKNLEKNSPMLDETLNSTSQTMSNISLITCGIRKTLSKKFGGLRLFFGRVIE